MGFIELERRLKLLRGGLYVEIIGKVLSKKKSAIIQYNRDQLLNGARADGSFLREYTKELYKGGSHNRVILRDTWAFHNSFFVEVKKDKMELSAKDVITNTLISEYGDKIFGLSQDNLNLLVNEMIPEIRIEIENFLAQ